jgi:hypothetical protein
MISIDEGIQIDLSDVQSSNADSPRLEIWQPDSNVSSERPWQFKKQNPEIVSTDEGIQID